MITNQAKPTTSYENLDKILGSETWATIPTTWATETRTWLDCISLFDNLTKITPDITNTNKPA